MTDRSRGTFKNRLAEESLVFLAMMLANLGLSSNHPLVIF